jgi:hypothetical protein
VEPEFDMKEGAEREKGGRSKRKRTEGSVDRPSDCQLSVVLCQGGGLSETAFCRLERAQRAELGGGKSERTCMRTALQPPRALEECKLARVPTLRKWREKRKEEAKERESVDALRDLLSFSSA